MGGRGRGWVDSYLTEEGVSRLILNQRNIFIYILNFNKLNTLRKKGKSINISIRIRIHMGFFEKLLGSH